MTILFLMLANHQTSGSRGSSGNSIPQGPTTPQPLTHQYCFTSPANTTLILCLGSKGSKGDKGSRGPPGTSGSGSGSGSKGSKGDRGVAGPPGPPGPPGTSVNTSATDPTDPNFGRHYLHIFIPS